MAGRNVKMRALKDFVLTKGKRVKKGEEFEIDEYSGRSLKVTKQAVMTGGEASASGFYNRRDMRADENATLSQASREVDAEGSRSAHRSRSR